MGGHAGDCSERSAGQFCSGIADIPQVISSQCFFRRRVVHTCRRTTSSGVAAARRPRRRPSTAARGRRRGGPSSTARRHGGSLGLGLGLGLANQARVTRDDAAGNGRRHRQFGQFGCGGAFGSSARRGVARACLARSQTCEWRAWMEAVSGPSSMFTKEMSVRNSVRSAPCTDMHQGRARRRGVG